MKNTFEDIRDTIKENGNNLSEIIRERLFSPMYFYFIIAWVITNWEFVYVLISTNENTILSNKNLLKIEFLTSFYSFNSLESLFYSTLRLFFIPAISAFVAVWWLTILSETFYKKYEQYKQNKRVIDRKLSYEEKVIVAKGEKEIRDIEYDKKSIIYDNNSDFNDYIDDSSESIIVGGIELRPSEALYNNDYEAYKEQLNEWKAQKIEDLKDKFRNEIIEEHYDELRGEQQFEEMRDR